SEVVLPELRGTIAHTLQDLGNGDVACLQADRGTGNADLRQAGAPCALPGDESSAARGAAVLRIIIGEQQPFLRNAVDVGRVNSNPSHAVGSEFGLSSVAHKNSQVFWFISRAQTGPRHEHHDNNAQAPPPSPQLTTCSHLCLLI